MIKIKDGNKNVYFDVDDTLVEWVHVSLDRAQDPNAILLGFDEHDILATNWEYV